MEREPVWVAYVPLVGHEGQFAVYLLVFDGPDAETPFERRFVGFATGSRCACPRMFADLVQATELLERQGFGLREPWYDDDDGWYAVAEPIADINGKEH